MIWSVSMLSRATYTGPVKTDFVMPSEWSRAGQFSSATISPIAKRELFRTLFGAPTMNDTLPVVYLVRHGETAWSRTGQHTSFTDLPLTAQGEQEARRVGQRLTDLPFAKVFTSPMKRAAHTCELAGFGARGEVDPDLVEWNYGKFEGRKTVDIH